LNFIHFSFIFENELNKIPDFDLNQTNCMKQIITLLFLLTGHLLFSQTGPYWLLKGGSVNNDEGLDISVDAAGNTYSTGYFSGVSHFGPAITLSSTGITDIFVAKVDPQGNYLWVVKAGGFGPDRGNSI
jgi:hypothetical protein